MIPPYSLFSIAEICFIKLRLLSVIKRSTTILASRSSFHKRWTTTRWPGPWATTLTSTRTSYSSSNARGEFVFPNGLTVSCRGLQMRVKLTDSSTWKCAYAVIGNPIFVFQVPRRSWQPDSLYVRGHVKGPAGVLQTKTAEEDLLPTREWTKFLSFTIVFQSSFHLATSFCADL